MTIEQQYLTLLQTILDQGVEKDDRTGVGVKSLFGYQLRHNCQQDNFPLLTTKKIHTPSVIHELLWFLKGSTNVAYLQENNVRIWNEWADEQGDLGPIYGKQWRSWGQGHIDQIAQVIQDIKRDPYSRRLIVSAWNVEDLPHMRLYPCHVLFQFYVTPSSSSSGGKNKLSLQLYQRSADVFLGVPFNIASYSLLLYIIAHITDMAPYEFIHTFGDVHLYSNHIDPAKEQLSRTPKTLPTVSIANTCHNIDAITYSDIVIHNYTPHPAIKASVAV